MSRKLMRVPFDFDWPLNKVWKGYINEYNKKCPDCENGMTNAGLRLTDLVHLLMLSGGDAKNNKNHPFSIEKSSLFNKVIPSKDMIELTCGLAGRNLGLFGHDAMDKWSAYKKIIEAAGLDSKTWGICKTCNGENIDPKIKELYDNWESYEPPIGEGYQLWENCSEGSPISPIFKTLEELCEWAESNATTFGSNKTSKENWLKMLKDDFVYHQEGNFTFM